MNEAPAGALLPCAEGRRLPLTAMRVRARLLLCLTAAAALAVALGLLLAGVGGDALMAAPALLLLLPLAAGRYVGSEHLVRIVRRRPAPRRRGAEPAPAPRRPPRRGPPGGRSRVRRRAGRCAARSCAAACSSPSPWAVGARLRARSPADRGRSANEFSSCRGARAPRHADSRSQEDFDHAHDLPTHPQAAARRGAA